MALILDGTNGLSDVDGTAGTPAIRGADGDTGLYFPSANSVALSSGGVNALIVDSGGFTTIGTAIPSGTKAGQLNVCGIGASGNGWVGQFGDATGNIAVLAGVRSGIASVGTQGATSLALNPDGGQVITPSQSAFIAFMTADSTATTVPFNATNLNRGSNFNTGTFSYTAPISGLYWFNVIVAYASSTLPGIITLFINGGRARDMFEANTWQTNTELHAGAHVFLTAGDVVIVHNGANGNLQGGNNNFYSQFSGHFIG